MRFQQTCLQLVVATAATAQAQTLLRRTQDGPTLATLISETESVSTLFSLLDSTGLLPSLENPPPPGLTVFGPVDSAFGSLDSELVARVTSAPFAAHLDEILFLHVVVGDFNSTELLETTELVTVSAESLAVSSADSITITAPGSAASVVEADATAANGVLHTVDTVLLPSFWDSTLGEVAASLEGYDIFNELVGLVDLEALLPENVTIVTVLAPNDDAFDAIGEDTLDFLRVPANVAVLEAVLKNHIIAGSVPSRALDDGTIVEFVSGQTRPVTKTPTGEITIGDAMVVAADNLAIDGIIHGIDMVITFPDEVPTEAPATAAPATEPPVTPPPATEPPVTSTLGEVAASLEGYDIFNELFGLVDLEALLPENVTIVTVLAPNDDAFDAIGEDTLDFLRVPANVAVLEAVLKNHIIAGSVPSRALDDGTIVEFVSGQTRPVTKTPTGEITIGDAMVVAPDNLAIDGIIHGIDMVITFPDEVPTEAPATAAPATEPPVTPPPATEPPVTSTLGEVAASLEGYDIFNELFGLVDLEALLPENVTIVTVLAPNDDAFDAIGEDTLDFLRVPANVAVLEAVLKNHIIAGSVPSRALDDGTIVEFVSGQTRPVTKTPTGEITIGDAMVVAPDNLAIDGIIHGIDMVITFPDEVPTEAPATAAPTTEPPVTPPPATEPPVTPAPTMEDPVSAAPTTEPPVTPAPMTEPPVTPAPVTEPPVTPAPMTEPPVTATPTEPTATPAPATDPPETPAPVTEPPETPAPGTDPPATDEPAETPPPGTDPPAPTDVPIKDDTKKKATKTKKEKKSKTSMKESKTKKEKKAKKATKDSEGKKKKTKSTKTQAGSSDTETKKTKGEKKAKKKIESKKDKMEKKSSEGSER